MIPQQVSRPGVRWIPWVGPVFLLFVLLVFFVTPGAPLDKLNMICFGI